MPQVSAELRWFVDAKYSGDIRVFDTWFRSGPVPPGGGKTREDVYVLDTSTVELGVKNREGKPGLEVKALVEPRLASFQFGRREGKAQLWSKVTSRTLSPPNDQAAKRTTLKTRWLRKFDTSTDQATEIRLGRGTFGEDPLEGSLPDLGCNVEWTLVEVPSVTTQWWTFGFEAFAFGQAGPVIELLQRGLARTLTALNSRTSNVPNLEPIWLEQSYPAWLKEI